MIQNDGSNSDFINRKYKITLENSGLITDLKNKYKTRKVPLDLQQDIEFPDLDKIYNQNIWRLDQIKNWFDEFGKSYFSELEIWHLNEIKNINI